MTISSGASAFRRFVLFAVSALALVVLAACDSAEERKLKHYQSAVELMEEGEVDKAIVEFRNALKIDQTYFDAHLGISGAMKAKRLMRPAAAHALRAAELAPDNLFARLEAAELLLVARSFEDARAQAAKAMELSPENPKGMAISAAIELLIGDKQEALKLAWAAVALDPGESIARFTIIGERIHAGDVQGALVELEAAETYLEEDAALLLMRLNILERMEDRDGVLAALQRIDALFPENEDVEMAMARWHMRANPPDTDSAEGILRKIAERDLDDIEAALRVVRFIAQTKDANAARDELNRLINAGRNAEDYVRALAVLEFETGDLDEARTRMVDAIERLDGEEKHKAMLTLSQFLDPVEEYDRRLQLISDVLEEDPQNTDALLVRGEMLLRTSDLESAIRDLRAALSNDPNAPPILELLAVAHEMNGSPDLARERRALAMQASDFSPEYTLRYLRILLSEGKPESAESILLNALARAPRNRNLLAALADVRIRMEDWVGADAVAAALAELDETDGLEDRLRATLMSRNGRLEAGIGLLQDSWERTGGVAAMSALVRAHVRAGSPDKALAFLQGILQTDPDNIRAILLMAGVRQSMGQIDEAAELVERAIEVEPGNGDLYVTLARMRSIAGQHEEAAKALERGLKVSPKNVSLRFAQAGQLEAEGKYEEAIDIYEALYMANPANRVFANNLASLLSDHRTDEDSIKRAATVARRLKWAQTPAFRDTYGWTLYLSGEYQQALQVLKESTAELAGNPLAQFHLGMTYARTKEPELAKQHLERALSLASDVNLFPDTAQDMARAMLDELGEGEGAATGPEAGSGETQ